MNDRQYVYIRIGEEQKNEGGENDTDEKDKQSLASIYCQSDEQYIKDS